MKISKKIEQYLENNQNNQNHADFLFGFFNFLIFMFGLIPFLIANYFNISIFLIELLFYFVGTYICFRKTHMGSVLIIGLVYSLIFSSIWYFISKMFI